MEEKKIKSYRAKVVRTASPFNSTGSLQHKCPRRTVLKKNPTAATEPLPKAAAKAKAKSKATKKKKRPSVSGAGSRAPKKARA